MSSEFETIFARLREVLKKHSGTFVVGRDVPGHFSLEAKAGPAAIKAGSGKVKSPMIPVAWVQIGKAYVSYHPMPVYGNPKLLDGCSKELQARMQGKSCFNFKSVDEALFGELERLTAEALAVFSKAGFVERLKAKV